MTREEAIRLIGWLKCTTNREDDLEAIDMAIEALQEKNIARDIATIIENEQDMRVMLQVVRCKDCKYRKKISTLYFCDLDEFNVKDADFCSWGERREK